MNKIKLGLIGISTCLLISNILYAQKKEIITYEYGNAEVLSTLNFTERANYELEHPVNTKRRLMPVEEEQEKDFNRGMQPTPDPLLVRRINRATARQIGETNYSAYLPGSKPPADTFISTISSGSFIPPDTHGGVDSNYCITAINSNIRIQRKNGTNVSNVSLDFWWSSMLGSGNGTFDPRVHYDPYARRWIMVAVAYGQAANSQLMISVSQTSNPTGTWNRFKVLVDPTGKSWLDFPNVGFNGKWVVVTGNFFQNTSGGATGAVAYVFDKAAMMANTGAPYTKISASSSFTLCPALTYDSTEANIFIVNMYDNSPGQLRLRKITGPVGAPVLSSSIGFPTSAITWASRAPGGNDFAKQLGSTEKIQTNDDRITNLVQRNGKLWCAHTIFRPNPGTATRSAVMWWQLDTTANPLQNGIIDDPATPSFYCFPSISVNKNDDAVVGFANMSANIHPSAAYAMRYSSDPLDSMRPLFTYRHGKNTYVQRFGGTENRWGDYSSTCIDPSNNVDFWTIQESVPASANLWDTWWARIAVCPANAVFSISSHMKNINETDTFTFTGTAPTGTTYAWDFGTSAIPATSTTAGPVNVKWTTTGWKKITLTVSTGTCSTTFLDSVLVRNAAAVKEIIPTGQAIEVVPNPNNGVFEIVLTKPVEQPVTIKLISMEGRTVYTNQFTPSNDNRISVPDINLPAGVYIVNVYFDEEMISQKLTINK